MYAAHSLKKQQLNLMIANQEKLPDVIFGIVDATMASEYGAQGLLCDITEFLEKTPRLSLYRETMTEYELNYFLQRLPDGVTGEIYHVPTPNINNGVDSQEWIGAISKTMAKNVGMDAAELKSMIEKGPGNYDLVAWGGHPTILCETVANGGQIAKEYTQVNTLADETGKGGYANIRDTFALLKNAVIPMNEAEPERMELAYLFCDVQYDWEVHAHWRWGVEITEEGGEGNWHYYDGEADGMKDKDGNWAGVKVPNDTWSTETNDTWHSDPIYAGATNAVAMGLSPGGTVLDSSDWAETGNRGAISYGALWEKWEHEVPEERVFDLIYTEDETEVMNEYKTLYMDFVKQARAQMVSGVIDPNDDAAWATYLAELKANGEDELVEAAQAAYTRMNG